MSGFASRERARNALLDTVDQLRTELYTQLGAELTKIETEVVYQQAFITGQLELLRARIAEERASGDLAIAESLAQEASDLETELARMRVRLATLDTMSPEDVVSVTLAGEPAIRTEESHSRATFAIAVFLALSVGVLLVLIVQDLRAARRGPQGTTLQRSD
jgi:flagellar motor switch/type III secretory pathway protein FliN